MMPIFLWSVLVSQSDHSTPHFRYLVINATVTIAPITTMEAAPVAMTAVDHVGFGGVLQHLPERQ